MPDRFYFVGSVPGNGERDDDGPDPYGGITYTYNEESVQLYAPNANNHHDVGGAIYTGKNVLNLFIVKLSENRFFVYWSFFVYCCSWEWGGVWVGAVLIFDRFLANEYNKDKKVTLSENII